MHAYGANVVAFSPKMQTSNLLPVHISWIASFEMFVIIVSLVLKLVFFIL